MDQFKHLVKNKKLIKGLLFILFLIPIFNQLVFSLLPLYQRFVFILYSLIFLLIGVGSIYLILKFSASINLLSEKALYAVFDFFIIVPIIGFLLKLTTTLCFITTGDEAISIAFSYVSLGIVIGAKKFKSKYAAK